MKIYFLYHRIFDLDGKTLTIGGIQTYILNLAKMLDKAGYEVEIYQNAKKNWMIRHDGLNFFGISNKKTFFSSRKKNLYEYVVNKSNESDLIVFGTDSESIQSDDRNTLSIQHGVSFDIIRSGGWKRQLLLKLKLETLILSKLRKEAIKDFLRSNYQVCVDYNFLNWIRTMLPRRSLENVMVIPNFTYINDLKSINFYQNEKIYILFARRFVEERGVYILSKLIEVILAKYDNVYFTVAGSGPLEDYLKNKFSNSKRVSFITFSAEESLNIHSKHHISLIPTVGSEGTSLSLLESMTSGCIPLVSNVGGMTNIVLDEFNGYILNPIAEEFIEKIEILIENELLRKSISKNAKKSVDNSFGYEHWKNRWLSLIRCIEINNQEGIK